MTSLSCPPPVGGPEAPAADTLPAAVRRGATLLATSALAGLFLAACNDGSTFLPPPPPPPPPAANEVPASAADSSASLEMFAISQPLSETAEPLLLDLVPTFPTSETEDPIVIVG